MPDHKRVCEILDNKTTFMSYQGQQDRQIYSKRIPLGHPESQSLSKEPSVTNTTGNVLVVTERMAKHLPKSCCFHTSHVLHDQYLQIWKSEIEMFSKGIRHELKLERYLIKLS